MKVYLPSNLDLNSHLERFPANAIDNFDRDKLAYILSLILSIPANNKDIAKMEGGWVPISSSILANKVKNYRQYLDYALGLHNPDSNEAKLIETDNQYVVGEKSKAYKFKDRLTTSSDIIEVEITNDNLNKAERKEALGRKREAAATYPNLVKFFNKGLEIDAAGARAYADLLRKKYHLQKNENILSLFNEVSEDGSRGWKFSNPDHQYLSYLFNISRIEEGNIFLSVDHNVRRFHSNLTNLKSELRDFITYEGHQLVNIDIKNSQPFLSLALLNPNFLKGAVEDLSDGGHDLKRKHRLFRISRVAPEIYQLLRSTQAPKQYRKPKSEKGSSGTLLDSLIMFSKTLNNTDNQDVNNYISSVTSGVFYEDIAHQIKERLGVEIGSRDEAKEVVFQVLFTDNRYLNQEEAAPKKLFAETFPSIYELFYLLKYKESNLLPRLLQSIESWLILDRICYRITREHSNLPLFTIHDSVVTVKGYEQVVKAIMEEEIEKAIGFKPILDIKGFDPEPRLKELSEYLKSHSS